MQVVYLVIFYKQKIVYRNKILLKKYLFFNVSLKIIFGEFEFYIAFPSPNKP